MAQEQKVYRAIGLMSGTSLDGVDVALIETDGHGHIEPLGFVALPYTDEQRTIIRRAFGRKESDDVVRQATDIVTHVHIEAVKALGKEADVIGFHGQTIYHAPDEGLTIQIGDAGALANALKTDVVYDFRSADIAAGGEGAPLAPLYHAARIGVGRNEEPENAPVAVLNIGGVANVTYIDDDTIFAFDTGPGNALIDDWVKTHTGAPYDRDGLLAKNGQVIDSILQKWLKNDYFSAPSPKSLDRDEWDIAALGPLVEGLGEVSIENGAATLMEFSVQGIAKALDHLPQPPAAWYVCGGGRHNKAMMERLAEVLGVPVNTVEALGWDGDATEAECFAYLAVRSMLGEPISLPTTTGVPQPMTGGHLIRFKS